MGINQKIFLFAVILVLLLTVGVACSRSEPDEPRITQQPTPMESTQTSEENVSADNTQEDIEFITVAIDAPARFPEYGTIDPLGNVIGFDPDVMDSLAEIIDIDHEFVVTGFAGMLDSIANGEFDAAMSMLLIPEETQEGLVYTDPYLEVGQVLMVLANNSTVDSYLDLGKNNIIGVQQFSSAEQTAREVLGLTEPSLQLFETLAEALQALIDRQVEGVILDDEDAEYYATTFPQQLRIAGGPGRGSWISEKAYGIAVSDENAPLVIMLNQAIAQARATGTIANLVQDWLAYREPIDAGESLVGTLPNVLVIGMVGEPASLDPGYRDRDLITWEIQQNLLGGLLRYDAQNDLVPLLAADFPQISEDNLEYTFNLRSDLKFPDGSELTAQDVAFSVTRAAGLGSFQVNDYLKDDNGDGFADADSIQVLDSQTIKFVLSEPTSFFPSILATPPFSVISESCYTENNEPTIVCGGFGPYRLSQWDPGEQMRLEANQQWPGEAPAFSDIQIRFYESSEMMRRSLENNAIDIAWNGLSESVWRELEDDPAFTIWEGPPVFKSYLIIEQSEAPWNSARIREAIALSIDREALAEEVFQGARIPLYSPVPEGSPGHIATEPIRDLDVAISILTASGYSPNNKLEMTIWFVDDGRYTILEDTYANTIKEQLEETGLIEVSIEGAAWEVFRPQSIACNYSSFLLGWPSIDQPPSFLEAMSWLDYFITNTDTICSNYDSQAMQTLYELVLEENDEAERLELYRQIQELWAQEFPTLDLTQERRVAIALSKVQNVAIDAMGLMHYEIVTKGE